MLRMSDLNSEDGSTDVIVQQESSPSYASKMNSLAAEMEHLKTEVEWSLVLHVAFMFKINGKAGEVGELKFSANLATKDRKVA